MACLLFQARSNCCVRAQPPRRTRATLAPLTALTVVDGGSSSCSRNPRTAAAGARLEQNSIELFFCGISSMPFVFRSCGSARTSAFYTSSGCPCCCCCPCCTKRQTAWQLWWSSNSRARCRQLLSHITYIHWCTNTISTVMRATIVFTCLFLVLFVTVKNTMMTATSANTKTCFYI